MTQLQWNSEKITIIASDHDIASQTIATEVEKLGLPVFHLKNKPFLFISDEQIPTSDVYLILSRHSSSAGEPAFTVHSVGNFSTDEPKLGGEKGTLGITQAEIQTYLLHSLLQNRTEEFAHFDIVAEATHHGPLLTKPVIFIEMGSNNDVWSNKKAANIIAKSIHFFFQNSEYKTNSLPIAIGFGGGHYPRKIADSMLKLDYAVGHICPKYALDFINEDLVMQMIDRTHASSKVTWAIFDKKGMKRKQEIKEIIRNQELDIIEL